jgi:hypothetical protein
VDSEEGEYNQLRPQSDAVTEDDIDQGFNKGLKARLH